MELLLLVESFAMVVVLLASAVAAVVWAFRELVRSVTARNSGANQSAARRGSRRVDQWDPNHPLFSKRAGQ